MRVRKIKRKLIKKSATTLTKNPVLGSTCWARRPEAVSSDELLNECNELKSRKKQVSFFHKQIFQKHYFLRLFSFVSQHFCQRIFPNASQQPKRLLWTRKVRLQLKLANERVANPRFGDHGQRLWRVTGWIEARHRWTVTIASQSFSIDKHHSGFGTIFNIVKYLLVHFHFKIKS